MMKLNRILLLIILIIKLGIILSINNEKIINKSMKKIIRSLINDEKGNNYYITKNENNIKCNNNNLCIYIYFNEYNLVNSYIGELMECYLIDSRYYNFLINNGSIKGCNIYKYLEEYNIYRCCEGLTVIYNSTMIYNKYNPNGIYSLEDFLIKIYGFSLMRNIKEKTNEKGIIYEIDLNKNIEFLMKIKINETINNNKDKDKNNNKEKNNEFNRRYSIYFIILILYIFVSIISCMSKKLNYEETTKYIVIKKTKKYCILKPINIEQISKKNK